MNNDRLKTIMLIEDDPGDALLIKEMLEQQECKARIVNPKRLAEGLLTLQQTPCDIILLDMNLPDSCGLTTLIRVMHANPDIPIIVLTGLADEAFGIEAVKAGAQDYLTKSDLDGRLLKRSMHYAVERKQLEISLKQTRDLFEQQARIDYLTGIYNRRMFTELLEAELQRARRYESELSLIMFDLDHFKQVNDSYSHKTGDHVLKEIALLVTDNIRSHDIFARWGGEEFMVLSPKNNREQATSLAEKLRQLCAIHDFGFDRPITASFGLTQVRDEDNADTLISRVDVALYAAKEQGRNRVVAG